MSCVVCGEGAREHPSQMGAAERVLYVPLARDFKSEMIPGGPPEVGAAEHFSNKYDKLLGCKLYACYWYQSHCGAVMPTGLESTHRRWVRQSTSFLHMGFQLGRQGVHGAREHPPEVGAAEH